MAKETYINSKSAMKETRKRDLRRIVLARCHFKPSKEELQRRQNRPISIRKEPKKRPIKKPKKETHKRDLRCVVLPCCRFQP